MGGQLPKCSERRKIATPMKPRTVTATAESRPSRLLIALAAAWLILSLAIGGAVSAEPSTDSATQAPITGTVSQP